MQSSSRLLRLPRIIFRRLCNSPNPNPNPNIPPLTTMKSSIKALISIRDPDKLAAEFNRLTSSHAFRRRDGIYKLVVRRLAASRRPDAVDRVLDHQHQYADAEGEGFAARLITLYGVGSSTSAAYDAFRRIPGSRSAISFNALLTAFARNKEMDAFSAAFREIPSSDPSIVPNVISYNILVLALCEKGDLDAALDTLVLMEKNSVEPNLITFNTLLNGFYGNGRFSDAETIWAQMKEKDTMSFNARLRGMVSVGKVCDAAEVFDEMLRAGIEPDAFTFNALIKGYIQQGDLTRAKEIYEQLVADGVAPNRWTFESLIPSLCEVNEIELALKMCNSSITHRCFVDVAVVQHVVDGLMRDGRWGDAQKLVKFGKTMRFLRKLEMPISQKEDLKMPLTNPLSSFFA